MSTARVVDPFAKGMMTQSISLPLAYDENRFAQRLDRDGQVLVRDALKTLQLNVGKMCNLACSHCHVEAGPQRTEIMTQSTMQRLLDWIDEHQLVLGMADLTGGAPEMNPHFRWLVNQLRRRGIHVMDRCNLVILNEPGYEDMAAFLAQNRVEISASLPCYLQDNVDKQRGKGVYDGSIQALQKLNHAGYGQPDSGLRLDLVYNPVGYSLPPAQHTLEADYRQHLLDDWGIVFNKLWTLTNMPVKRFEHALKRDGMYDTYMQQLVDAHHADNVPQVMCKTLVSVGWQGSVYDCDFNQMLQMPLVGQQLGEEHVVEAESKKLWEFTPAQLIDRAIATGSHCFGCTAGAGSSCTGALT